MIPTNKGILNEEQIIKNLNYICYAHNRDSGISHENLVKIGLGNELFKEIYNGRN